MKFLSRWAVPLLLLLGAINVLSGGVQLASMTQGGAEDTTHYLQMPTPIVAHIVAGILFSFLGPLQLVASFRKGGARWHKWSGRLLVLAGFVTAVTAIWMNLYYPLFGGVLKSLAMWVFGFGLIFAMAVGVHAIVAGNTARHRAWMLRALAIGLAPATQRLFFIPVFFAFGGLSQLTIGIGIWVGFVVNLLVAEWGIRHGQRQEALIKQEQEPELEPA